MGSFAKGEIVLFPFPYTDLTNRKLRPCLVLSNEMNQDILLCQITSQNNKEDNFCVALLKKDTKNGSLQINSFIKCNMLFTADKKQIARKICKINKNKYLQVFNKIREIIR